MYFLSQGAQSCSPMERALQFDLTEKRTLARSPRARLTEKRTLAPSPRARLTEKRILPANFTEKRILQPAGLPECVFP